eukprot:SAG11_NODE_4030_length_2098_cov_2.715358_1_plen_219_part_10
MRSRRPSGALDRNVSIILLPTTAFYFETFLNEASFLPTTCSSYAIPANTCSYLLLFLPDAAVFLPKATRRRLRTLLNSVKFARPMTWLLLCHMLHKLYKLLATASGIAKAMKHNVQYLQKLQVRLPSVPHHGSHVGLFSAPSLVGAIDYRRQGTLRLGPSRRKAARQALGSPAAAYARQCDLQPYGAGAGRVCACRLELLRPPKPPPPPFFSPPPPHPP